MIKEYETRESKIIYYNKNKKIAFLKNFLEISPVSTLKMLEWSTEIFTSNKLSQ